MHSLPVAERFVSINGEGRRAGELAVFLRFCKCNLQCSFCDTRWANSDDVDAEVMTTRQITSYVMSTGVQNVTLTGGEPLLQKNIGTLIASLDALGLDIEIETNGSVPLKTLTPFPANTSITMDYKLPGSGMEKFMCLENFSYLTEKDTIKFVVNYIWMDVSYKGKLENGKRVSECEYFKIFFEKNGDEVYVTKIGVSVGEDGISDLDV